jgi:3-oxoadipate enol-lactonase
MLEMLPDAVLALAPDLRGCGQSEKPDHGYGIVEQAEELWELTSALGLRDFDLVGHSTGGAIAIEFALQHREVLHSLTLVASTPIEGVYSPVETLRILDQMQEDPGLLSAALELLMPALFPLNDEGSTKIYFDSLVQDASEMAPAAFTAVAEAIAGWNRFGEAHRLTLPTLLMWGELDQIVDREAITRTLIALPGANNLEVLRGVGHSPMIESPLTFTELLIDFITEDYADYDDVRDTAGSDDPSEVE